MSCRAIKRVVKSEFVGHKGPKRLDGESFRDFKGRRGSENLEVKVYLKGQYTYDIYNKS